MSGTSALMEVEELGPTRLAGVAERLLDPAPAFGAVIRSIEQQEGSVFANYAGKYVDTGKLKASLTQTAATGAIRRLTPTGLTFGTSVWYARYQGTRGVGSHGGSSAVLRATPAEAAVAARSLAEYALRGGKL